jgi:protein-S-isoprenylcysteine O-methyltransferase Ste14
MPKRVLVAAGNFFFKVRNALFPVVYLALLIFAKPAVLLGSPVASALLLGCGAALALAGEFVRCLTIGYDYIERGGRGGKVYASFLVKGGVYAHSRNPMYVGNCLIAVGLILYSGAPLAILFLIPFFLFVYESITTAEEAYLAGRFGDDYRAYCARVNRYLPAPGALYRELSTLTYDGKKALRKEYGTLWVVGMGLTGLPWWRMYHLQGAAAAKAAAPLFLGLFALLFVAWAAVFALKKKKRLG